MKRVNTRNKFMKNKDVKSTKKSNILLLIFALLVFNLVFQDIALAKNTKSHINESIFTIEEKAYRR